MEEREEPTVNELSSVSIRTKYGEKKIHVYCCDVLEFDEPIDILTTSAFRYSYAPTPRTLFEALDRVGISVRECAAKPEIDLRRLCGVWLSKEIENHGTSIGRIGCVEMTGYDWNLRRGLTASDWIWRKGMMEPESILTSIMAYFRMLDIAAVAKIKMDTVALPLLGAGSQRIEASLTMIPLLNECIGFLKRNEAVKKICFIERSPDRAEIISEALKSSYAIEQEQETAVQDEKKPVDKNVCAFISHSSLDKNIADNLCFKLESRGIKVWYAPRDVQGAYASSIVKGIKKATHFIVILSRNSMNSQHVLNEVDLAFRKLPDKIKFKPLRIDDSLFTESFDYYLSTQHWMDAHVPPLEKRLEEFVDLIESEL
jgi:hypothetical protein